ncbi:MAG: NAD(P)-dependent oxidoreductase [Gammaproteobacteria bacterium]|nr:NAD(P)-dependent oxidoreductase [Gammaproteobacteria bacterium]
MNARRERCALQDRRIVVTGASGFLGRHLCRRLSACSADVHAVSRNARTAGPAQDLRWWQGDAADAGTVRELVHALRPDTIVHLSGRVTALPDLGLVLPTLHSLLVSAVNVLTAAAEIGDCRVVLAGSLTEPQEADAAPTSPYSAAKWAGSAYARMFHRLYGLPVVVVRPFMTYGPAQDPSKLIPSVATALLEGRPPKLSSGHWQADWIFVDDVVDGIAAALSAPAADGCTIDLGTGRLVSVRTIVQHLVHLTDARVEPLFGTLPERPLEPVRAADTGHAFATLGWRARTPLLEGLRRTLAWYARPSASRRS